MSPWQRYLLVALGSAIGGCARYWVGGLVAQRLRGGFPWGTFAVNVTGCFLIGLILAALLERSLLDARWRLFLAVGFCGGYTTFSTFGYETLKLIEAGSLWLALANVGGSVLAGVAGVLGGFVVMRLL